VGIVRLFRCFSGREIGQRYCIHSLITKKKQNSSIDSWSIGEK
jgi:hypothetical protein